ncbi:MAG: ligand-binding sensor domain-containing protein [Glaciecola sp.]
MKSFIIILLLCFYTALNAQQYNFKRFSVEEGLSQPGLFCLQEDYHGNLWVGLDNGGVQVFDGWKFKTIDNRITSENISALFKSSEGDMWIGSSTDYITVLGSDTVHLGHEQGLVSNHVRSFCEDIKGNIWMSAIGGGVVVFEDKIAIKSYGYDNGLPSLNLRAVLSAHNGNVWVGTDRGAVVFKDYQVVKSYRKRKAYLGISY